MKRRVVLHIGSMKTGTSFIQSVLQRNETVLSEAGFEFLGGGFGVQSRAVRDMLKLPRDPGRNRRRWKKLATQARAGERTGIVSMEFLSFAGEEQVRRLVAPFSAFDVQVVLTVRDQFRVLPAQWQTYTRNFGTDAWDDYLRHIQPSWGRSGRSTRAWKTFHRAQDIASILSRWQSAGVSSVDVITVPPPGAPREELWHRFCAATGIPATGTVLEGVRDNVSLGYASCDFLRRANEHLADIAPRRYRKVMRPLASTVLAPLRDSETRPELDVRGATFARSRNEEVRGLLGSGAYQLWGSLDDLPVPGDLGSFPHSVPPPPAGDVLRAARAVWDHLAEQTGTPAASRPDDLDALVVEGTRLLRQVNRWDR
jgi:hypothetical protein